MNEGKGFELRERQKNEVFQQSDQDDGLIEICFALRRLKYQKGSSIDINFITFTDAYLENDGALYQERAGELLAQMMDLITKGNVGDVNNTKDENNNSVLHFIVEYGDSKLLNAALEKGGDLEIKGQLNTTLLHWAVLNKDIEVLKILLENGAHKDVRHYDSYETTPLHRAALNVNEAIIKLLASDEVELDKDLDKRIWKSGKTPLHWAVQSNPNLEVIKYILDSKGDIASEDEDCKTPFHIAAEFNTNVEVMKLLFEKDDQGLDKVDTVFKTPLHYAAKCNSNTDIIKFLAVNGNKKNLKKIDTEYKTPSAYLVENKGIAECLPLTLYIDSILEEFASPVQEIHKVLRVDKDREYLNTFAGMLEALLQKNDSRMLLKWLNLHQNFTRARRRKPLEAKELQSYIVMLENFLFQLFDSESLDDPNM